VTDAAADGLEAAVVADGAGVAAAPHAVATRDATAVSANSAFNG
jgi:hypothetical protein